MRERSPSIYFRVSISAMLWKATYSEALRAKGVLNLVLSFSTELWGNQPSFQPASLCIAHIGHKVIEDVGTGTVCRSITDLWFDGPDPDVQEPFDLLCDR